MLNLIALIETATRRNWSVKDRTSSIDHAMGKGHSFRFNAPGVEIDAHFTSNGVLDVFYLAETGKQTSRVDSLELGGPTVAALLFAILEGEAAHKEPVRAIAADSGHRDLNPANDR